MTLRPLVCALALSLIAGLASPTADATRKPQHLGPEIAAERAATGAHAPGQWRTNGPLLNQAGFGEAFGCKAGSQMQLKVDDRIVLWR